MTLPAALACSYLIGSIPTAYLVVRALRGIDVRSVGSGNVGATNVTRAAGFGPGAAVFLVDAFKGVAAARLLGGPLAEALPWAPLACGACAVLGHDFPVWLRFRGGKGVATTIGVVAAAAPAAAAVFGLVWAAAFLAWRYVSVASMLAGVVMPAALWRLSLGRVDVAIGAGLSVLLVWQHRENVRRLAAGREHRAGQVDGSG